MRGLMMDRPLLVSMLIEHADRFHGDTEIVSRRVEGDIHRYTYREAHRRSRQLARALMRLGIRDGERIGTLAWNGYRHFETYFATSGIGAICHTINPRLFPEQIRYIIDHAEDRVLFCDVTFLPLLETVLPTCRARPQVVLMIDRDRMPAEVKFGPVTCYDELLAGADDDLEWPVLDENSASSLCYTSGTTGHPKGVLYSHRSTLLHALGLSLPDSLSISARETVLPVVPMFHVNAWGLPYAAPLTGAKLVFPGKDLDGKSLHELFETERVTFSAGVPTVWLGLINYLKQEGLKLSTLKRMVIGGSACPPAMMRALEEDFGVEVIHAWGMTELSPLGTSGILKGKHLGLDRAARTAIKQRQGRPVFGVDVRIVDGTGRDLPWDGNAFGDLLVRGPWVCSEYFRSEDPRPHIDGWFPTGDVCTVDPDGYINIVDRSKDVVKSGGEWISSIDVENVAMGHPAVQMAAVIAAAHPKWGERPLLVVVKKPGQEVSRDELLAWFDGRVARWWIPDDAVFVDAIPLTATGKMQKLLLRERFRDHQLPGAS